MRDTNGGATYIIFPRRASRQELMQKYPYFLMAIFLTTITGSLMHCALCTFYATLSDLLASTFLSRTARFCGSNGKVSQPLILPGSLFRLRTVLLDCDMPIG